MCSNFYIVSGVRRIKGFKRYQRENWRTGTRYLEDIKNEDCHLFAKVGIEDGKQRFRCAGRGCASIQRWSQSKPDEAAASRTSQLFGFH